MIKSERYSIKIAISIPDELFQTADHYAKSHGVSRSNLYAQAVAQFLATHSTDHITKQLNAVYSSQPAKLNKTVASMQFSSIDKKEW